MEFENKYILGDVFLKNFYQVYNLKSDTIGLGVAVSSPIKLIDELPVDEKGGMSGFGIFVIIVIILVILVCIGFIVYKKYQKKK